MASDENKPDTPYPSISVTGTGFIEAEPDLATVNVSISEIAESVNEAKKSVDRRYTGAVKALRKVGIPDDDIRGARIHAQKEYEWRNSKQIYKGEKVTRPLTVKVRDTELYGDVLQALVDEGISTIDSTELSFSDENGLRQQALGVAADNARSNAEFLAKRLDRKLGPAYRISDQGVKGPTPYPVARNQAVAYSAAAEADVPQEMFGTQKINATVTVEFELR